MLKSLLNGNNVAEKLTPSWKTRKRPVEHAEVHRNATIPYCYYWLSSNPRGPPLNHLFSIPIPVFISRPKDFCSIFFNAATMEGKKKTFLFLSLPFFYSPIVFYTRCSLSLSLSLPFFRRRLARHDNFVVIISSNITNLHKRSYVSHRTYRHPSGNLMEAK